MATTISNSEPTAAPAARITIDPLAQADVPAVAAIEHLCHLPPWHEGAYETEIANRSAIYLVARCDQVIAGFAGMWVIMDEVHVTTIAVHPRYRRLGIGERLLIEMLESGVWHGASRATLEVRQGNAAARALYRKYGFEEAGVRKRYYADNDEHAIVMWADGIDKPAFCDGLARRKSVLVGVR